MRRLGGRPGGRGPHRCAAVAPYLAPTATEEGAHDGDDQRNPAVAVDRARPAGRAGLPDVPQGERATAPPGRRASGSGVWAVRSVRSVARRRRRTPGRGPHRGGRQAQRSDGGRWAQRLGGGHRRGGPRAPRRPLVRVGGSGGTRLPPRAHVSVAPHPAGGAVGDRGWRSCWAAVVPAVGRRRAAAADVAVAQRRAGGTRCVGPGRLGVAHRRGVGGFGHGGGARVVAGGGAPAVAPAAAVARSGPAVGAAGRRRRVGCVGHGRRPVSGRAR